MKNKKIRMGRIILFLVFILIAVATIFPFYYLVLASFRPSDQLFRKGMDFSLDPSKMTLNNYKYVFLGKGQIYFYWYRNSILITSLFTIISLFLSSMVGYGLAIYHFKGRNLIFTLVLFILMIPLEILMLPLYKLIISFKIINTYWGVVLPFAVSPLGIFFFRQYASGLQKDYLDAGRIDGCTEYGLYFRIMAPLMKPAFGAMAILLATREWNSFIWPLIVLRTNEMFTIPIGLAGLLTPYGNNYDLLISGAVLAVIPIIILFIFNQKSFISGLTLGGVKG
jgi:arabinosaccharide transport system permease protein